MQFSSTDTFRRVCIWMPNGRWQSKTYWLEALQRTLSRYIANGNNVEWIKPANNLEPQVFFPEDVTFVDKVADDWLETTARDFNQALPGAGKVCLLTNAVSIKPATATSYFIYASDQSTGVLTSMRPMNIPIGNLDFARELNQPNQPKLCKEFGCNWASQPVGVPHMPHPQYPILQVVYHTDANTPGVQVIECNTPNNQRTTEQIKFNSSIAYHPYVIHLKNLVRPFILWKEPATRNYTISY